MAYKTCPNCRGMNRDTDKKCYQCKKSFAELEEAARQTRAASQESEVQMPTLQLSASNTKGSNAASLVIVMLFFGVFALGGIFGCSRAYRLYQEVQESKSWVQTEGVIRSSQVRSQPGSKSTTYSAAVVYDFEVNQRHYHGDRVSIDATSSSRWSDASSIVNGYAKGTKVQVYYSRTDPWQNCLQPGSGGGVSIAASVGIVFSLVGWSGLIACGVALAKVLKAKKEG